MSEKRKAIECKTCNAYTNNACSIAHFYLLENKVYECPCKMCIVKAMCSSTCSKFMTYSNGYYEFMKFSVVEFQKFLEERSKRTRWVKINMARGHKYVVDAVGAVEDIKNANV